MSQYPSPYNPPPTTQQNYGYDFNYYQPAPDLLAPARRAGVMMFVIGGLLALGGLCCGAMGAFGPVEEVLAQNPVFSSTPGVTADMLKLGIIVMGVMGLLFGMVLLILGYFVRGGGMVPIVIGIVLVALATLLNLVNLASTALQLRGGGPEMIGGLCVNAVPLVLLLILLATLIQAARAAPRVAMMKSQYQQQYWQYQQQQQMYQAGYMPPPPPPMPPASQQPMPPPPVPPPPASDSPSPGDSDAPSA